MQLRVSCHRLQIELGRYHKPCSIPPEQRLRKLCNYNEDEIHFLCVCPVYNNLRDELYTVMDKFQPSFMYLSILETNLFIVNMKHSSRKLISQVRIFSFQIKEFIFY